MEVTTFAGAAALIREELDRALASVDGKQAEDAVQALCSAERVFVVAVGRVLLSLSAFAKRLNHLGIPAVPVGAIDEPPATPRDLVVVASGSGESIVPVAIAGKARSLGARVLYIGSNQESAAAHLADLHLRIPCPTRLRRPDEIPSRQPLTSLFEQALLLTCEALSLMILDRKGMDPNALWQAHANLE